MQSPRFFENGGFFSHFHDLTLYIVKVFVYNREEVKILETEGLF